MLTKPSSHKQAGELFMSAVAIATEGVCHRAKKSFPNADTVDKYGMGDIFPKVHIFSQILTIDTP